MDNLPINWCRTFNSILRTLFISQWFWESRARCQFRFEVPPIFERLDFRNRMKETYLTFLGTNLSPPKLVEKKSFWIGILLIEEILLTSWGWYFYPIICRVLKNPSVFSINSMSKDPFERFFANPYRELKDSSPDLFALHFQPLLQKANHLRETWQLTQ